MLSQEFSLTRNGGGFTLTWQTEWVSVILSEARWSAVEDLRRGFRQRNLLRIKCFSVYCPLMAVTHEETQTMLETTKRI